MIVIEELTANEWADAYPVLSQLWPVDDRETYRTYLQQMTDEGYRLFALREDDTVVSVAGVFVYVSTWYDEYLWVHDLVTDAAYRSEGYGQRLLGYLEGWARERDLTTMILSSGLNRPDAHQFYERIGMEKVGYRFKKSL